MDYLLLALQSVLSVFGIRGGYEQPAYEVLARLKDGAEVRQYAARVAAETVVEGVDEPKGRNEAFDRLAKYIFGANRARAGAVAGAGKARSETIAMTAPVQTAGRREKVAMTAPVQTTTDRQAGGGNKRGVTMRFFLPKKLTVETAPTPTDARVRDVAVPAETVAVLRFSGSWDERGINAKKAALLKSLEGTNWKAAGEPYTLFYDPPFTFPFLRRNEVAVAVERAGNK
jgi:hypothetical protein